MTRFLAAALLLTTATLSAMHLHVEKTSPQEGTTVTASPEHIRIWFSEAPTLAISTLTVTGPGGKVELGKVALGKTDDALDHSLVAEVKGTFAPGTYVVTWKSSGKDGHIQTGTYEFAYKNR